MPVLDGIEPARKIKATVPESALVILSLNATVYLIEEAKKIGVNAYVAKTEAGRALAHAIQAAVLGGDFVLVK